ncbi:MAG: 2-C-methyl-D-erythritol 4-phosphate cytidylyltransferase [Planctomycetota bacterium]
MKIAVIIVAAGSSTRLKGRVRKPYRLIKGKPMLLHSIRTFSKIPSVSQIIIAIHPDDRQRIDNLFKSQITNHTSSRNHRDSVRGKFRIETAIGGATRSHSVYNALQAVDDGIDIVLVHDAARPFVERADIIRLIGVVRHKGAAILARPVTDTIKSAGKRLRIDRTIPRNTLWAAQTPQGFKKEIILKAYRLRQRHLADYTDDAGIVESARKTVYIVKGSASNIKITTPVDL